MMTNEEYALAGGHRCPYCKSNQTFMIDDNEVECDGCNKTWIETYEEIITGWRAKDD